MTEHILGTLRAAEGEGVVRMEDRFEVGVEEVWSAVTDPARLAPGGDGSRATCASGASSARTSPTRATSQDTWTCASPRTACG